MFSNVAVWQCDAVFRATEPPPKTTTL